MKALITGSGGFVGKYLKEELCLSGYDVVGIDLVPGERTISADILDFSVLRDILSKENPDVVFHLAGQADVGKSWKMPQKTFELNVITSVNLMEAIKQLNMPSKILFVGTSDEYGDVGRHGESVSESLPLQPGSPYAISKRAQEDMAMLYSKMGIKVFLTRSFNHGGAGQREGFVISDFAAGIARIEKGLQDKLMVGNLEAKRDFTHVRDVVRAYRLIVEKGRPGEVYNVGSGNVYSIESILKELISLASVPIKVEKNPAKIRPSDTPVIRCDNYKLIVDTGWNMEWGMTDILYETLNYYRKEI